MNQPRPPASNARWALILALWMLIVVGMAFFSPWAGLAFFLLIATIIGIIEICAEDQWRGW